MHMKNMFYSMSTIIVINRAIVIVILDINVDEVELYDLLMSVYLQITTTNLNRLKLDRR